jgi:ADP-heptose:LPS heptosyltransferase
MNVDFQRRVDRIAGTFLCAILSLLPRRRGETDSVTPNKILIILLTEMGSLVLAQPMIRRIRETYPDAAIYALVFKQNREVLDALGTVTKENILTVRNTSMSALAGDSLRAWKKMRRLRIDTVIDCELFSRISSIYSYLSGAAVRVGFHRYNQEGLFRGRFINRPVLYNPYQHMAHQFITLAEAIGHRGFPLVKRPIDGDDLSLSPMEPSNQELGAMTSRIREDFPQLEGSDLVLINPGGGLLPVRAWPLENFCTLARNLVDSGYGVGITGMARDRGLAEKIQSFCRSDNCIDLTGYTATVRELMVLFHLASLLITNDGGPGHFASVTPVPSIILFGPETPTLYGPLDPKSMTLYTRITCSPCLTAYNHRNSPCDGDNQCLKSIEPESVLKRAYAVLSQQAHE